MPVNTEARNHPLQKWLDLNKKTQASFAREVSVHCSTISNLVNKNAGTSAGVALAIERATGREVLVTQIFYPDGYP